MSTTGSPSRQEQSSSFDLASFLLLALSVLWCVYWFAHAWHYWEDDAYIHLEFARSVAAGKGFAFNGRVVAGDTSPLWVLLIAGLHIFVHDWMIAGKVLTVLGAVFGFAGMYSFARSVAMPPLPGAKIFPAAMVLLIALNPYSCYWIFSGMEPIAAAGLACFAVLAATRKRPEAGSFLAGCLLAGLAPLLRPEMIFLTGLLALALLAQARRLSLRSTASRYATWLGGLILIATPLVLWSLYSLHAFGHVVPNTNAAKRANPGDSVIVRLLSIYAAGLPVIVCGLLAGIATLILRFSAVLQSLRDAVVAPQSQSGNVHSRTTLPLSGWIFIFWAAIATVFYVVDHTYVQTRYILVTAPGLMIVILSWFLQRSQRLTRTLFVAGYAAALAVSIIVTAPFIRNKALNCQVVSNLAVYMRDSIPPDAPVASYSIGEVAFISEHPIVDTGGITRPEAIPYGIESPAAIVQWARSTGAQYYIDSAPPVPRATAAYTAELPFTGWTFRRRLYATSNPVSLWKFPPLAEPELTVKPSAASN